MNTAICAAIYRHLRPYVAGILIITPLLITISCSKDKTSGPGRNDSASAIMGRNGGTISITDNAGVTVTLKVPRGALTQDTNIGLAALESTPTNPIATHLFTGVRITPDSLRLNEPAALNVRFASGPLPQTAVLFSFKNPQLVMPLGDDTLYENTVEGVIFHFSEYGGGDATSSEALDQGERGWNSIPSDPMDWWDIYENVNAMEKWADMLDDPWDMPEDAQALRDRISEIVNQVAANFLNLPVPDPLCDDPAYLMAFYRFAALVMVYGSYDIQQQFDQRQEDISAHCLYDGNIEYGHNFIFSGPNYNQVISVTGTVEFHINPYTSSSTAIYGGGTTYDAISGNVDDCTVTGSGENQVSLSGIFHEDVPGSQYFQVDFSENWYTSSVLTIQCPDEDPESSSMPPTHNSFSIVFPFQDGYVEAQPFIGQGGTGTYTWTLHITHQPE